MGLYQVDVEMTDAEVAKVVAFLKTLTGKYNGEYITSDNDRDHIDAEVDHEH